jgi:hypothetical protein
MQFDLILLDLQMKRTSVDKKLNFDQGDRTIKRRYLQMSPEQYEEMNNSYRLISSHVACREQVQENLIEKFLSPTSAWVNIGFTFF